MTATTWKWLEGGGVEVGGATYAPAEGLTPEAVRAYGQDYAQKTMVFTILFKAKRAFETGTADYQGARDRLPDLLREYGAAERELDAVVAGVDRLFTPSGLHLHFPQDVEVFGRFLEEVNGRLGVKA